MKLINYMTTNSSNEIKVICVFAFSAELFLVKNAESRELFFAV